MRPRHIALPLVLLFLTASPLRLWGLQASQVSALAGASMLLSAPIGGPGVPGAPQVQRIVGSAGAVSPGGPAGGAVSLTTSELQGYLRNYAGRVTVVYLYAMNCPRSRAYMPTMVALADRYANQNVAVLAIAVRGEAELVPHFLAGYQAPFEPLHIRRDPGNDLARDLAAFGIRMEEAYYLPFTSVLDRSGNAVEQGDGTPSIRAIETAIRSQL